jgi:hypothetical protein
MRGVLIFIFKLSFQFMGEYFNIDAFVQAHKELLTGQDMADELDVSLVKVKSTAAKLGIQLISKKEQMRNFIKDMAPKKTLLQIMKITQLCKKSVCTYLEELDMQAIEEPPEPEVPKKTQEFKKPEREITKRTTIAERLNTVRFDPSKINTDYVIRKFCGPIINEK